MKKLIFAALVIIFIATSCSSVPEANTDCSTFLSFEEASAPLSKITLDLPANWEEIKTNQTYSNGPGLLHIFVFETSADPEVCVTGIIEAVSLQSEVLKSGKYSYDFYIDNIPSIFVYADGYSDSNRNTPWRGIYAGVAKGNYVYVFTFDAFGLDTIDSISTDVDHILSSIRFK